MKHKGVIFVTGAGSGIGLETVERLIHEGYAVGACDINIERLKAISSDSLISFELDVRNKAAIDHAVTSTVQKFSMLTGVVACVGVFPQRPFLEIDENLWDFTFDVNLKGALFTSQAVIPYLRVSGKGSIVFYSSSAARYGTANGTHYASSKGGILGLARVLAVEVAQENIRVNVISPGITDTPQPRGNMTVDQIDEWVKHIPLQRIGLPKDMVEASLFLLEDDSSFITGQDLRINGGALIF